MLNRTEPASTYHSVSSSMTHTIEAAMSVADDADSSLLTVKFSEMKDHGNVSDVHSCDEHFLAHEGVYKEAMNDADFDVT